MVFELQKKNVKRGDDCSLRNVTNQSLHALPPRPIDIQRRLIRNGIEPGQFLLKQLFHLSGSPSKPRVGGIEIQKEKSWSGVLNPSCGVLAYVFSDASVHVEQCL